MSQSIVDLLFGTPAVKADPSVAVQKILATAKQVLPNAADARERERIQSIASSTAWSKLGRAIPPDDCVQLFGMLVVGPGLYSERRFTRPRTLPKSGISLANKLAKAIRESETVPGLSDPQREIFLKFLDRVTSGRQPVYSILTGAMPLRPTKSGALRTFVTRVVVDTLAQYTKKPMREAVAELVAASLDENAVPTANTVRRTRNPKTAL